MSAFGNALVTMILLGLAIGIMGAFFKNVSSEYTTLIIYAAGLLGVVPLAFGLAKMDGLVLNPPTGFLAIAGIAACGIMIAFADYFGVKAFNAGGSTLLVASMISAAPAVSTLVTMILVREMPKPVAVLGFFFLAIGVSLIRSAHPPPAEAPAVVPTSETQL